MHLFKLLSRRTMLALGGAALLSGSAIALKIYCSSENPNYLIGHESHCFEKPLTICTWDLEKQARLIEEFIKLKECRNVTTATCRNFVAIMIKACVDEHLRTTLEQRGHLMSGEEVMDLLFNAPAGAIEPTIHQALLCHNKEACIKVYNARKATELFLAAMFDQMKRQPGMWTAFVDAAIPFLAQYPEYNQVVKVLREHRVPSGRFQAMKILYAVNKHKHHLSWLDFSGSNSGKSLSILTMQNRLGEMI